MNIESSRRKYEDQMLQLPNVTGIGIGQRAGKDVIKIFVTRKLPESALQPHEIIPKTLDEYQTDVEEIGVVTAQEL
ncbi:MAG: hypothetical protein ABI475_03970 [Methylophilaceae bacterium]